MLGSQKSSDFSRTVHNELAKGYYPTDPRDIAAIGRMIVPNLGYVSRGERPTLALLDPCAGEGRFLSAIKRSMAAALKSRPEVPYSVVSYAVEMDAVRFGKIRADQKLCGSFFDTEVAGEFSLILLNPPYHRNDPDGILNWVKKCARSLAYSGFLVLIVPEYEFRRPELQKFIGENFRSVRVGLSHNHAQFKQVVALLSPGRSNADMPQRFHPDEEIGPLPERSFSFRVPADPFRPLLTGKNLEPLYAACSEQAAALVEKTLSRLYPQNYDASIQPLATLRTAHAVQLAAMNSQIESVVVNGTPYLAKYALKESVEVFEDAEAGTETIIKKPGVEAMLMDHSGLVSPAKELGLDYYDLNSQLSGILLTRLNQTYAPLHEIGGDPDFLKEELDSIGLLPPQKEAVKAIIKGYRSGARGLAIRANTGTGKTWMAKAIKLVMPEVKRTIFVTEPHLVPQIAQEFGGAFPVHRIESWEDMVRLEKECPEGLFLIAYSRLRMYPAYTPAVVSRRVASEESGKKVRVFEEVCPDCWRSLDGLKIRKADKEKCPHCGAALFTYIPENDRAEKPSFGRFSRAVDAGTLRHQTTHNKQLPYVRLLKRMNFDLAVFDELHNAANLMSNQGAAFIRLASSSKKVLGLTATITNGMAKSLYNILWGLAPEDMDADNWDRVSATEFQARYGAYKQVRKTDEHNRHRGSEKVTTQDTAGISPAVLRYTVSRIANVDSEDFVDLPPTCREVIRCEQHPKVEEAILEIENILEEAAEGMTIGDRLALASVRNHAMLRVADTFNHFDDELTLTLRGVKMDLGVVRARSITGLTDKEAHLIRLVKEAQGRGEKVLVYTGNTQKCDMRPVLSRLISRHTSASVEVLTDSVPVKKVISFLSGSKADVLIAPFKRVGTGVNISERPTIIWYDYTSISRLAEQGDGRNRRVNTVGIHEELFGEVRPCRYYYLVSGPVQEFQLSYTLEKRMISKLAEGEIPDIDPADLANTGEQSFSAMLTRSLQSGNFNYADPGELLKKMTQAENDRLIRRSRPDATAKPAVAVVKPAPAPHAPALRPAPAPTEQLSLFSWA